VQKGNIDAIRTTMQVFSHRNPDILSTGLRTSDGKLVIETGEHKRLWQKEGNELSSPTNVMVPIFKDKTRWGTFEVSFKPVYPKGLAGLWAKPIVKVIAFLVPLAFIGYLLFMKKTLRHLDPGALIPSRVKAALDALVEGVVLLDKKERIVLANTSFAEKVGESATSLVGRKASKFEWSKPNSQDSPEAFPWQQAILEREATSGIPLSFYSGLDGTRTFMVNGAPILDDGGAVRGALATFDDVTELEAQNDKLKDMLRVLEKSREEVRSQNQKLQVLATQDPLTQCLNRRSFFERFEMEFNRSQRYGHALSCIMADIDNFKSVNDTHGHQMGDQVLQKVAERLRSTLRESDVICRYGGEEFCVLLPHIGADDGLSTSERVRSAIASQDIYGLKVTISLGISSMEFGATDPQELLGQADNSLYAAKNSGRNKSIRWDIGKDWRSSEQEDSHDSHDQHDEGDGVYIPHHVVNALMLAMGHRDMETAEHSRQVAELCVAASQGLMSLKDCHVLEVAGELHDIGKLGVPDSILQKPESLSEKEWQIMHEHKRKSVEVIASTFLSPDLVEIVRYNNIWFEGSQENPKQPRGKDIPLGSRILSIADAFSSMVSHRPYRATRTYDEAFTELRRCAGKQFDPDLVEHFIEVVKARDESRQKGPEEISNAVKLEIGREVEKIFVAVNTSAFGTMATVADQLAVKAHKHGLKQVAEVARKIEKAIEEEQNMVKMVSLASELTEICGAREIFQLAKNNTTESQKAA